MKKLTTLALLIALTQALTACHRTPDRQALVERLPELPQQIADTLAPTKEENVLVTQEPPPSHHPSVLPREPKAQSCDIAYWGFVVYPLTECRPWSDLADGDVAVMERQLESSRWTRPSEGTRWYKLSKSSTRLTVTLVCGLNGGPWFARVTTHTSCDDSVPDHSKLEIIAGPQPFSVSWDGELRDVPPPFDPHSFDSAHEDCTCCAGFTECPTNHACVPQGVNCTAYPARTSHLPSKK